MEYISEPERDTPIIEKVDVVVAGAGPAGFAAAVAAARSGVRVLLCERTGILGGNATLGIMQPMCNYYVSGEPMGGVFQEVGENLRHLGDDRYKTIPVAEPWMHPDIEDLEEDAKQGVQDIADRLEGLSAKIMIVLEPHLSADTESLKYVLLKMVEESGVKLLLHSLVVGALVENGRTRGIIVENKSGRQAIRANVVVDATGDADVAAFANAEYQKGRKKDGLMLPMGFLFRMVNVDKQKAAPYRRKSPSLAELGVDPKELQNLPIKGLEGFDVKEDGALPIPIGHLLWFDYPRDDAVCVNCAKVVKVDGTNAQDLTYAEVTVRKQAFVVGEILKRYVPGFENAYVVDSSWSVGVRQTRRIIGEYILTTEDVLEGRRFPDGIVRSSAPLDLPGLTGTGGAGLVPSKKAFYEVPYRCLVPRNVDGMLVAGRCISTTYAVQTSTRLMGVCFGTGQAAGAAAALAVKTRVEPRKVNSSQLRSILIEQGLNI